MLCSQPGNWTKANSWFESVRAQVSDGFKSCLCPSKGEKKKKHNCKRLLYLRFRVDGIHCALSKFLIVLQCQKYW